MKCDTEMLLLELTDKERILRLGVPADGLCLEKRLDPAQSVACQKQRWAQVFTAMLEREPGAVAKCGQKAEAATSCD